MSETDSRSSSTAAAGGGSRKRSTKDCRRLSQRIAQALRKPTRTNVGDSETVCRDESKDEAGTST